MKRTILLAAALVGAGRAFAQAPSGAHMLNLSCVEALVSIGQPSLAGVFSFIPEKDAPAAFADLIVHNTKALKKFVAKMERDQKEAGGISTWDHDAVSFAVSVYKSPLAETLDKPGEGMLKKLEALALAPAMTLQELTAHRRKG